MKKISYLLNKFRLYRKFKRTRKKHGALSIKVSAPLNFLHDLELAGIKYCVMRWPDKVPTKEFKKSETNEEITAEYGDIDLLIDIGGNEKNKILDIGAHYLKGTGITCEFYSTNGSSGFSYKRYPYYPPLLANEMMEGRQYDERGFYRLTGLSYIKSLAYHVVYHKAASTCQSTAPDEESKIADYMKRLELEAIKEGVDLPVPLSLKSIQKWLNEQNFDMPYDLKIRWPRNAGILTEIIDEETSFLHNDHDIDEYTCVFMLRSDLEACQLVEKAIELVGEKFSILEKIEVPSELRHELGRHLRGGNWVEGRHSEEILPCMMLICRDTNPVKPDKPDKTYPHLDNLNLRHKTPIRNTLSDLAKKKLYAIHSSDNQTEAIYVISILKKMGLY